jgi:transcription antitermination factor NusG
LIDERKWDQQRGLRCLGAEDVPGARGKMLTRDRTIQAEATDEIEILQADASASWFVLHTLSRHFLPLVNKAHYYGRRKVVAELPLFPGYVFLLGSIEQAYTADRTGRVANILPVADQEHLNWELGNLQIALQRNAVLDIYPNLRAGARVEVRSGPFRRLQGVIDERPGKRNRLFLQVTTLGKGVSLEIDGSLLDLLE